MLDRRKMLQTTGWACAAAAVAPVGRSAAVESGAGWPQWRGPSRDSQVHGEPWPGIGPEQLKKSWRIEMGPSYSTPIVSGPRVFVTETRDKRDEVVTALDRESGKQLWQADWRGAMRVPFFAARNGSWIRCTPAVDDQRLYVGGMKDVLVALDVATGEESWRLNCVKRFDSSLPSFGLVSSPLLDGEFVFVQAGGGLLKVARKTGEVIWRKLTDGGGMYGSAFSSPIIATLCGVRQLLVQTRKELVGVDLDSGEKLWSQEIPAFRGMNILTPHPVGDMIFTSSYQGGSRALALTRSQGSNEFQVEEAWTSKSEAYMSSPVTVDGHIYLHLRNRRVVCFEAQTGEKRWTTKETFGQYWSMVANGDQILALDQEGELLLLKANPEKPEVIERRTISKDETWGHLAIADRQAFVRELNAIAAYQWVS